MNRIRAVTLNLYAEHGDWDERSRVIRTGLSELRPDLIAFQEAVVRPGYDQAADVLNDKYHVHHHRDRGADGAGCSLATLRPATRHEHSRLDVGGRAEAATAAAVEVDLPGPIGRVWFVQHNGAWQLPYERDRELQAVATAEFIHDVIGDSDAHVLLAGDFNAAVPLARVPARVGRPTPRACASGLARSHSTARTWRSAMRGRQYARARRDTRSLPRTTSCAPGRCPLERGRRIDHTFVRCGEHGPSLDIASCELVFNQPVGEVWASDHFGVLADFVAPAAPQASKR